MSGLIGGPAVCAAADDVGAGEAVVWRAGRDFQQQLQLPVGISWSDMPLRQGLWSMAKNQRVPIWLDRRVDPNRVLDLTTSGVSLQVALQQVAAKLDIRVGFVGNVVYLGPPPVAERVATIAALKREAVEKLPTDVRAQWQQSRPFQWDALTSPSELLGRLAAEIRVNGGPLKVVQPERLPHDLWWAGDYPALPLTDRLTLLLAGFDLSFDLSRDGTAVRLAPLPESVAISRTYSAENALRAEQQLAREFPGVKLERRGNRLTATGRFEELEAIGRLLRGETLTAPAVDAADLRFDLKVDNTEVSAIIAALKKQRNLSVKVDPAVNEKLATRVTFDVRQATLTALLEAVLKPAGIAFRLNGTTLELFLAAPR